MDNILEIIKNNDFINKFKLNYQLDEDKIIFLKDNDYIISIDKIFINKTDLEKELKNGLIDYYENIKEKINKDIKNNKKEINILKQNNKKLEKEIILLNNEIINIKGEQLSFL
jgi:hypothetical protein